MSGVLLSHSSSSDNTEKLRRLTALLAEKDNEIKTLRESLQRYEAQSRGLERKILTLKTLDPSEIARYSRQIILPEIGVQGQTLLKKTAVLIVGAGGLGCPAAAYLAAAGIGKLGIVDYDVLEVNNLHRQIFHREKNIGHPKCESLASSVESLNSLTQCVVHNVVLNSKNIKDIFLQYDIIVDASDNVPTRYLLNDAAVLYKKPLISGSALRFEGQLTIYNYDGGPCYRCLYPSPPPPETITNCSEGGILGAVTGVIGSLQALEVIKIASGLQPSYNKKLLLFDGKIGEFRTIKLRKKKSNCVVCGELPKITKLVDYEAFCKTSATDKVENITILSSNERISCKEYKTIVDSGTPHILLDVRPITETGICCIPSCITIPLKEIDHESSIQYLSKMLKENCMVKNNYVICHRGNDSQRAVKILQQRFKEMSILWFDIEGGLQAWHDEVDPKFPVY